MAVHACFLPHLRHCNMHIALPGPTMPQFASHLYHLLQQAFCQRAGVFPLGKAAVHKQTRGSLLFCTQAVQQPSLFKMSVPVQCAPLVAGASTSQLLCNVLQHHMQLNVRPCGPCSEHQQRKVAQGHLTTARTEGVIYDTIQAVKPPVMLLVSV